MLKILEKILNKQEITIEELYLTAMENNIELNERVLDITEALLNVEDLDEMIRTIKEYLSQHVSGFQDFEYSEDKYNLKILDGSLFFPLYSKTSGELGTIILKGDFDEGTILSFLIVRESVISIIEGTIVKHRLTNLLTNAVDSLFTALNKRANVSAEKWELMEKIAIELAKIEGVQENFILLALKITNVGLIGVPDDLLVTMNKRKLTDEELKIYMGHLKHSVEILEKTKLEYTDLDERLVEVTKYHHERLDGSGPYGLTVIPKESLILGFVEEIVLLKNELESLSSKFPDEYIQITKKILDRGR